MIKHILSLKWLNKAKTYTDSSVFCILSYIIIFFYDKASCDFISDTENIYERLITY